MEQNIQNAGDIKVSFDFAKTPITQIADYIIINGAKQDASDIHFDPRENGMMVRFRIDGDLQDYTFIPKAYERNLSTRLKLLANMNITETRLPQDGAIKGVFGDVYLDMRVSSLPLNEGEKIVLRILDYSKSLDGLDTLGFHPDNLVKLNRMMSAPNGIILVAGATGTGKSTTTYSMLQTLNKPERNIITVEDPIEMDIQGINQVQVNPEIGMTFSRALRSILRQDPNVILIGEIRDSETAQIAVRAAITGHLVLSTIHTNNSLSTIERLLDMDVERYLLSTALTGIISQRLAKKLCPYCRWQRPTTPYEKKIFRTFMMLDVGNIWEANENGCEHCRRGYKGRIAFQEVLEIDDDIRTSLTNDHVQKETLKKQVYTEKTITLLQDALLKALNGLTTFEEVYRVIEMENEEGEDYKTELTSTLESLKPQVAGDPVASIPKLVEIPTEEFAKEPADDLLQSDVEVNQSDNQINEKEAVLVEPSITEEPEEHNIEEKDDVVIEPQMLDNNTLDDYLAENPEIYEETYNNEEVPSPQVDNGYTENYQPLSNEDTNNDIEPLQELNINDEMPDLGEIHAESETQQPLTDNNGYTENYQSLSNDGTNNDIEPLQELSINDEMPDLGEIQVESETQQPLTDNNGYIENYQSLSNDGTNNDIEPLQELSINDEMPDLGEIHAESDIQQPLTDNNDYTYAELNNNKNNIQPQTEMTYDNYNTEEENNSEGLIQPLPEMSYEQPTDMLTNESTEELQNIGEIPMYTD